MLLVFVVVGGGGVVTNSVVVASITLVVIITQEFHTPSSVVVRAPGYGILGPMARRKGWAPGAITDWKDGATGWILWVSLAIMLGDSLTSLSLLLIRSGLRSWRRRR